MGPSAVAAAPPPPPLIPYNQMDGTPGRGFEPPNHRGPSQQRAQAFARGPTRGPFRGPHGRGNIAQIQSPMDPSSHSRGRGPGRPGHQQRLFNPHDTNNFGAQPTYQAPPNVWLQIRYLNDICNRELQHSISAKELKNHENFRRKLERILQDLIREWAKDNVTVNPGHVKLRCYGSMANGFAVPGSDMDLLLMFPKDEGPIGEIETESRRMFEKALLEKGIGARLLTKTRVPILRVCQYPGQDLLNSLRTYRLKSLDQDKEEAVEKRMKELGLKANRLPDDLPYAKSGHSGELDLPASIPLPTSPTLEQASIEFDKSVGVQCDINFSNQVAIHNTSLLKCYCICDDRVRQLGLVVKAWVKARKINTPYYGTLSSYGYILMTLHFLLNVADPPVIPNLQKWAKSEDSWNENPKDVPLFEGFDVRFMGDEKLLEKMAAAGELTHNRESLGSLLRGFFAYYADPRGFHFGQEVISIRSNNGILRKAQKGWTEAKRAGEDSSIRLRYLLCIEDPFEIEHNVARTVGHSGIVAIRDEFRRAWDIVNKIELVQGRGWEWRKADGNIGEDLFAPAEDRGDLLKKDADFHKERLRAAVKLRDEQEKAKKESEATQQMDTAVKMTPVEAAQADGLNDKPNNSGGKKQISKQRTPLRPKTSNSKAKKEDSTLTSYTDTKPNPDLLPEPSPKPKPKSKPKHKNKHESPNHPPLSLQPSEPPPHFEHTSEPSSSIPSIIITSNPKKKKKKNQTPKTHNRPPPPLLPKPETNALPSPSTLLSILTSNYTLSPPFDPFQLRDLRINLGGGNACLRHPQGNPPLYSTISDDDHEGDDDDGVLGKTKGVWDKEYLRQERKRMSHEKRFKERQNKWWEDEGQYPEGNRGISKRTREDRGKNMDRDGSEIGIAGI